MCSRNRCRSIGLLLLVCWAMAASVRAADDPIASTCGTSPGISRDGIVEPDDGADRKRLAVFEAARRAVESHSADADVMIGNARSRLGSPNDPGEEDLRERLHFARTLILRADGLRDRESVKPDSAEAIEAEAASHLAWIMREAERLKLPRLRSWSGGYRSEIYARAGRMEEALDLNQSALLSAHAASDAEALARWHAQRGRILRELGQPADARSAYEHARSALERLRYSMEVEDYLELARPILLPLADLLLREAASEEREDDEHSQRSLEAARIALEGLKTAELRDFYGDPCLATATRKQAESIPGAVILYPVILDDRLELIVSRGGELRRVLSSSPPREVVEQARLFRLRLLDPTTLLYRQPAEFLFEALIRPIEGLIDETTEALVVVPTGPLFQIPLAALRDARTNRFLVEIVPVAVTPSLELTDPRPIDRTRARVLVAGLTTESNGMAKLPAVPREIDAVVASFPGRVLEGESFTLERFESAFDERPFGIVHIASHGSFEGRSEESFILTYDTRVPIDRLAEIVGRARDRVDQPLELLTLSTCESAMGDDRALLGLAGIAVRAGARSALASLWTVNDEATADLITRFYRELAKPGVSRATALQRAQKSLLASDSFRHPIYWAAFILINGWL